MRRVSRVAIVLDMRNERRAALLGRFDWKTMEGRGRQHRLRGGWRRDGRCRPDRSLRWELKQKDAKGEGGGRVCFLTSRYGTPSAHAW